MRIVIIIFLSILSFQAFSQSFKQYVRAGDKSLAAKDYYSAMRYYQNALEIKEDNIALHYKAGTAARAFFAYTIAESHFDKVKKSSQKAEFPLLDFYMADVKQTLGKYDEAAVLYESYYNAGIGSEVNLETAEMGKSSCEWAMKQKVNKDAEIRLLDKTINSKFSEFGGSWQGNDLVYSSLKYKDESVSEDRRIAKTLSTDNEKTRAKTLRIKGIPEFQNVANATFDETGETMYFTVCEYINTVDLRCDIYYAKNDGKRWISEKLESPVNLEEYTQTQPAWSNHENWEGLFFSSDRPEGKGGMDIWFAKFKGGNVFEEPINVSGINTPFNEITPGFDLSSDDVKLYFSSDGYISFGKYDVYQSDFDGEEWSSPENMGLPVNSGYNDVYFWKNAEDNKALVSSNRPESKSMLKDDPACCNDLYAISLPKEEKPRPEPKPEPEPEIIVEIDKTPKPESKPIPTTITIIPTSEPEPKPTPITVPTKTTVITMQNMLPLKVYFDNDEPDKRTNRTRTIKSYSKSYNEYILRESVFYDKYVEGLPPEQRSEAMSRLMEFFNNNVRKGYADLQTVSYMVLNKLESGKKITIEVKGFTSPRAKSAYNHNLAQRRTSSLLNHFNEFLGGSFLPFIQSGQLRIVELPLGETTAPAGISDSLSDEKNSIYSPEASLERRAEVVAVKVE